MNPRIRTALAAALATIGIAAGITASTATAGMVSIGDHGGTGQRGPAPTHFTGWFQTPDHVVQCLLRHDHAVLCHNRTRVIVLHPNGTRETSHAGAVARPNSAHQLVTTLTAHQMLRGHSFTCGFLPATSAHTASVFCVALVLRLGMTVGHSTITFQ